MDGILGAPDTVIDTGMAAMLNLSPEVVCYIIVKAREFDAKVDVDEPDPGSNPSDGGMREILEDHEDDPTLLELTSAFESLNDEQKAELLALVWLGRGDYVIDDWDEALASAWDTLDRHFVRYMTGIPLLGDFLEEGLSQHGYSCTEFEIDRL